MTTYLKKNYAGDITFSSIGGTIVLEESGSETILAENKLNCSAKGYPIPNLSWEWDGQVTTLNNL